MTNGYIELIEEKFTTAMTEQQALARNQQKKDPSSIISSLLRSR